MVKQLTTQLTQADVTALDAATLQRLTQMYCILNLWCWPNDLPDPEKPDRRPAGGKGPFCWDGDTRRHALMNEIERRIGMAAHLVEWNRRTSKNGRGRRCWTFPIPQEMNYISQR